MYNSKDKDDSVPYQKLLMLLMKSLHIKYGNLLVLNHLEKNNKNKKEPEISESYKECIKILFRILKSSIEYGQKSAPVASGLITNCIQKIEELIRSESFDDKLSKKPSASSPSKLNPMVKHTSSSRNIKGSLLYLLCLASPIEEILNIGQLSKTESRNFNNLDVIVQCLLMRTSSNCRQLASSILLSLVKISDNNYYRIIDKLEDQMGESVKNDEVSEQFFELLSELLKKDKITELVRKNQENEDMFISLLSKLFDQVSIKLDALAYVQKRKERLGADGLYVELNQGKALGELISIICSMIQVDFIKTEFKNGTYTYFTIKILLNLKKLFLLKNKTLIDCEDKINNIFKEINSDSEEDKEKFILACVKLTNE